MSVLPLHTSSDRVFAAKALTVFPGDPASDGWGLDSLAGRFVEIAGGAATAGLTLCARLIFEAQQTGGLAAWVGGGSASFFPPDFAACGVDLAALAMVRVKDGTKAWRACDMLLRSGGFALVVLDTNGQISLTFAAQTRLTGLAQRRHAALVALTHETRRDRMPGSMVSLRAEAEKRRTGHDCFACDVRIVKDKRRTPGWQHVEICRGTDGLC